MHFVSSTMGSFEALEFNFFLSLVTQKSVHCLIFLYGKFDTYIPDDESFCIHPVSVMITIKSMVVFSRTARVIKQCVQHAHSLTCTCTYVCGRNSNIFTLTCCSTWRDRHTPGTRAGQQKLRYQQLCSTQHLYSWILATKV